MGCMVGACMVTGGGWLEDQMEAGLPLLLSNQEPAQARGATLRQPMGSKVVVVMVEEGIMEEEGIIGDHTH